MAKGTTTKKTTTTTPKTETATTAKETATATTTTTVKEVKHELTKQQKLQESVGFIEQCPPLPANLDGGNVRVTLRINYLTNFGETMCVAGSTAALGDWDAAKGFALSYAGDARWEGTLFLPFNDAGSFEYKYFVRRSDGSALWEDGCNRVLRYFPEAHSAMEVTDAWRTSGDASAALLTSAFQNVIFGRKDKKPSELKTCLLSLFFPSSFFFFSISISFLFLVSFFVFINSFSHFLFFHFC